MQDCEEERNEKLELAARSVEIVQGRHTHHLAA